MGPDLFISTSSNDREAVALLNDLFHEAAGQGVSDIHFQEQEGECRVRYRLPGGLVDRLVLPRHTARMVDDKIRSRAQLPAGDRKSPLDGRMRLRFPDRRLDVRVAISPNISGQLTVCRLLDQVNAARRLIDIEMTVAVRDSIQRIVEEPNGLFLVTGPTGSGKTTTLYAIINELNDPCRNIITIENPVEYQVAGISQINIDGHVDFAGALRAVLRQDPDIILIGEIRDAETAQIAVQAAITGHLVLASLHANNAAVAVTRMIDLGVDPITLAASLRGVTAQRLVRRIAGEPMYQEPNEAELAWLRQHGMRFQQPPRFATPQQPMAYQGNVPVIEFIVVDAGVRRAATHQAGAQAIYAAASLQPQFETLAQAGARLALAGLTSLAEVRRITSEVDVVAAGESRLGNILVELGVVKLPEVTTAIAHVIHERQTGRVLRLGESLLELRHCTPSALLRGMGQAPSAALGVAEKLMADGVVPREAGQDALQDWRTAGGSLFDRLVEAGLCDWGDIHEAANIPAGD